MDYTVMLWHAYIFGRYELQYITLQDNSNWRNLSPWLKLSISPTLSFFVYFSLANRVSDILLFLADSLAIFNARISLNTTLPYVIICHCFFETLIFFQICSFFSFASIWLYIHQHIYSESLPLTNWQIFSRGWHD